MLRTGALQPRTPRYPSCKRQDDHFSSLPLCATVHDPDADAPVMTTLDIQYVGALPSRAQWLPHFRYPTNLLRPLAGDPAANVPTLGGPDESPTSIAPSDGPATDALVMATLAMRGVAAETVDAAPPPTFTIGSSSILRAAPNSDPTDP